MYIVSCEKILNGAKKVVFWLNKLDTIIWLPCFKAESKPKRLNTRLSQKYQVSLNFFLNEKNSWEKKKNTMKLR